MAEPAKNFRENAGCGGHGGPSLGLDEARARMLASILPVEGAQSVPVRDALGRILAADVISNVDVPAHRNSAMDGYALSGADLPAEGERRFEVVGTSWAGRPFVGAVSAGQCVRIMTGASVPEGADTVVMQEQVRREDDFALIGVGHRPGENVRPAGEDLGRGDVALAADTYLRPAHLGLIASLGVSEIRVRRRPRVAFFSTGDELKSVGEPLAEGQIYDSNRYTILGMLTRLGVEPIDLGVVRDRQEDLEAAFAEAARRADAIITSGGVSVGEADFVTDTLDKLGEVGFWTVAMKPGRPIAFGRIGGAWFFGLPGNPVSVMATFYQLVQPALQRLAGIETPDPPLLVRARTETKLRKKPGRLEFQRGVLSRQSDGSLVVRSTGHQGSGILRSMAEANCFIVLEQDRGRVEAGEEVQVQPFQGLA
jgi:molybdopterin molybdotransferase